MKYITLYEAWSPFRKSEEEIKQKTEDSNSKDSIDIPKVFGNKFEIYIRSANSNNRSNIFDNIYNFGAGEISSSPAIEKYVRHFVAKMDNESLAITLEKLANDYRAEESYYSVNFTLDKSQLFEFLDLLKKASLKLEI